MPQSDENHSLETETGFGTGLRTHLKRLKGEPNADPGEAPVELEADATGLAEDEQPRDELEDARDREEALRSALADQVEAYERLLDLERDLARRAEELEERERRVVEQADWIQAETWRLGELRTQLEAEQRGQRSEESSAQVESPAAEPIPGPARAYLRRRLEEDGERVWSVFEAALEATKPTGEPDFATRLLAAKALLSEAYGDGQSGRAEGVPDELANIRARRATTKP